MKASTLNPQQPQRRRYVLRRSNGYFVDSSYGFDRFDTFDYKAGSGEVVAGFDQAIKGMYPGGRRRWDWVRGWRVLVISLFQGLGGRWDWVIGWRVLVISLFQGLGRRWVWVRGWRVLVISLIQGLA